MKQGKAFNAARAYPSRPLIRWMISHRAVGVQNSNIDKPDTGAPS